MALLAFYGGVGRNPAPDYSNKVQVSWTLFAFPDEGDFNALSVVGPLWKIYFYDANTTDPLPVFSDSGATIEHASPVMLDRYGNLPVIYTNGSEVYDVVIKNQFGVTKHTIEDFA